MKKAFLLINILLITVLGSYGQMLKLKGKITDADTGEPLNDINVKVKDRLGYLTTTNTEGIFSIDSLKGQEIIIIDYPGYKTQNIYIRKRSTLNIQLIPEQNDDGSDIFEGAYKEKRIADYAGAVKVIRTADMHGNDAEIAIDSRIQGHTAGLHIINKSGAIGETTKTFIRGISSLQCGNQPLYIVDGLPLSGTAYSNSLVYGYEYNTLADINPNDIESITVIKDAASTSIYGVRGANGVIIINTKKGNQGKTSLTLSVNTAIADINKEISLLNADQYKTYFMNQQYNGNSSPIDFALNYGKYFLDNPKDPDFQRYNNNHNWQDEVKQRAILQDYHFKLKGGDAIAKYAFSVGMLKNQSVIKGADFMRFTSNFNINYKINEKLSLSNVLNIKLGRKSSVDQGYDMLTNPLFAAMGKMPMLTPFIKNKDNIDLPKHEDIDFQKMTNPAHLVSELQNNSKSNRLMGNIAVKYKFRKNIYFKTSLYIDYNRQKENRFYPDYGLPQIKEAKRYAENKINSNFIIQNETTVHYNKNINNSHNLNAFIGVGITHSALDNDYGHNINSASDYFKSLGVGIHVDTIGGYKYISRLASAFANIDYIYKDKYLLNMNLRNDASSKFGKNAASALFYGLSVAWRFSEENLLNQISWLNNAKLRLSYGTAGNGNLSIFDTKAQYMATAYNMRGATYPLNIGNPDLKWETTKEYNLGLDATLLRHKFNFNIDYYVRNSYDIVVAGELPSFTGYKFFVENAGEINNKGVEINLSARWLTNKVKWTTMFNITKNTNRVESMPDKEFLQNNFGYETIVREGSPVASFYGFRAKGVYKTDEEAKQLINGMGYSPFRGGDIIFEDISGADGKPDGIIDAHDKTIIGNPNPDLYGGIFNRIAYKGFSLNILFTYSYGNDIVNGLRAKLENMSSFQNQTTAVLNSWKKQGDETNMPRIAAKDPSGNSRFSSRWVEDGSFVRLKQLTLNYRIPQRVLTKTFIRNAQLTLSAHNLFIMTKYLGLEPETYSGNSIMTYGLDLAKIPQARLFSVGIKLGL